MSRGRSYQEGAADALAEELAALPGLSLDALKDRWQTLYGVTPPRRLGRALMHLGVAYKMQERAFGGLKPVSLRRLNRAAQDIEAGGVPATASPAIRPGTRLLRQWRGRMHEVIVREAGFHDRDRTWRSLSAIAREITGARWSGPLFFGLKGRGRDGS